MKQKRILIVDDEKNIRFTVVHSLQSDEFKVDAASSGVEGLQLFTQNQYDLLLVDLRMPGMTGIEMLREIRQRWPEFPAAVVITAYGIPQQLLEAAQLGAIDYVRKPFSIQTIRSTVREIIERTEMPENFAPVTAEDFLRKGKQVLMIGKRQDAERHFKQAVELKPDLPEGYILLGICDILNGKPDAAKDCFRRVLLKDPSNKAASEYLSWLADAQI